MKKMKPEEFLNALFHTVEEDSHQLAWRVPLQIPMTYPIDTVEFLDTQTQYKKKHFKCYISTASVKQYSQTHPTFRHKKELFISSHFMILDDVGDAPNSKVAIDNLPEGMRDPSYIIETSKGNHQYGYIFDTPIYDYKDAMNLVRSVTEHSGADMGGCMPVKAVRMIGGVHGGSKDPTYPTTLKKFTGRHFSPDELLKMANCPHSWAEVKAIGEHLNARGGLGYYASRDEYVPVNYDGSFDILLSWLEKSGELVSLNTSQEDWVQILCPFRDKHSKNDAFSQLAGYSPIGVGKTPDRRGFHCFHDSCADITFKEAYHWWYAEGAPDVEYVERVAPKVKDLILDMSSNTIIDKVTGDVLSMQGWKTAHREPVMYPLNVEAPDKIRKVPIHTAIIDHPKLVKVQGTLRKSTHEKIIERQDRLYYNEYRPPKWGKEGGFDKDKVTPFLYFLKYLFPHGTDAKDILKHIACKAQYPQYRGAGHIYVAPAQGTGRGSFSNTLKRIWGAHNVRELGSFADLIDGISGAGTFNEFLLADWLVIREVKQTVDDRDNNSYEKLKNIVDPAPTDFTINRKYGKKSNEVITASLLFFSQYENPFRTDAGDTRFKTFKNVPVPGGGKTPEDTERMFSEYHDYLETSGFEEHVWRYLHSLEVDPRKLFARQKRLTAEQVFRKELRSGFQVDTHVAGMILFSEECMRGYVPYKPLIDAWGKVLPSDEVIRYTPKTQAIVYKRLQEQAPRVGDDHTVRIGGSEREYELGATLHPKGATRLMAVLEGREEPPKSIHAIDMTKLREMLKRYVKNIKIDRRQR